VFKLKEIGLEFLGDQVMALIIFGIVIIALAATRFEEAGVKATIDYQYMRLVK
jgi:hypothetical protein